MCTSKRLSLPISNFFNPEGFRNEWIKVAECKDSYEIFVKAIKDKRSLVIDALNGHLPSDRRYRAIAVDFDDDMDLDTGLYDRGINECRIIIVDAFGKVVLKEWGKEKIPKEVDRALKQANLFC